MPSCFVFRSGKKQQDPLVLHFGALKNNNALLCGILGRQKTTMPSCAEFWAGKKQRCPLMRYFKTTKCKTGPFVLFSGRPFVILPSSKVIQRELMQVCLLGRQIHLLGRMRSRFVCRRRRCRRAGERRCRRLSHKNAPENNRPRGGLNITGGREKWPRVCGKELGGSGHHCFR